MTSKKTLDRIERASLIVRAYRDQDPTEDDTHTLLVDLLCDLQHFAQDVAVDFQDALFTSTIHYNAEK